MATVTGRVFFFLFSFFFLQITLAKQAQLLHPVDSVAVSFSLSLSLHLPVTQFCRAAAHIITFPTESLL